MLLVCYVLLLLLDRGRLADSVVVGKELAKFNKSKSTWATVGSTSLPMASQPAAAGPSSNPGGGDEAEDIKPDIDPETGTKRVVTKRKGGLKTAAQIREDHDAQQAEKARALAEAEAQAREAREARGDGEAGPSTAVADPNQGQTVHRDASGRKVDVEKLKREAKAQEEEERRKAREREEWSKGLVQRQKQQDRAREEAEMGNKDVARYVFSSLSRSVHQRPSFSFSRITPVLFCIRLGCRKSDAPRYANDAKMNKELAEVSRWNDPAADFLTVCIPFYSHAPV